MNVNKMTKAQIVDHCNQELASMHQHVDELRAENAQLRRLCEEWAIDSKNKAREILRLKARLTAQQPSTSSTFAARCAAYCEEHGVRSVPQHVAQSWFKHGHASR